MSRLIPAAERIIKARALIQKARDLPVPEEGGRGDLFLCRPSQGFIAPSARHDQIHFHDAECDGRDEGRSQEDLLGSRSGQRGNPALMFDRQADESKGDEMARRNHPLAAGG